MSPGLTSRFVACEALIFLHMVPPFIRGEAYLVNVHCIRIRGWLPFPKRSPSLWGIPGDDVDIPFPDFSESYDVSVELSCFVKPLFPSPSSLLHTLHCHGILFPFPFRAALCCLSPDRLCRAVQARLCHKRCRHVIGLGPYRLSMTSYPSP